MDRSRNGLHRSSEMEPAFAGREEKRREEEPVSQERAVALARLSGGADALERRLYEVVREEGAIVDEARLLEATICAVACHISRDRDTSILQESRLRKLIAHEIDSLTQKDRDLVSQGSFRAREGHRGDQFIVDGLGFHPEQALLVGVRFHAQPKHIRRIFLEIFIRHTPPTKVFEREGCEWWSTPKEMVRTLFKVIQTLRGSGMKSS